MNWILVMYIYAGVLANGDSVALQNIQGFVSKEQCVEAGKQAEDLVRGSSKVYRFVCIRKGLTQ
jgi:hypothetical protein